MPPLLPHLRAVTRPLHDRLDGAALSARVTDHTLTPTHYRALLSWQRHAHAVAENGLADFPWPADYRYRPRWPTLDAEAATLDLPTERVRALARPATLAAATGRAYVLEGASLGGNMILGHLRANEALAGLSEFAFYTFQRDVGLGQWRSFAAFAKTHDWSPAEVDVAGEEAIKVFGVFAQALPTQREAP